MTSPAPIGAKVDGLWRIHWVSKITGYRGQGEKAFEYCIAKAWLDHVDKEWGDIIYHWLVREERI